MSLNSSVSPVQKGEARKPLQHGWQSCRACHDAGQDLRVEGNWHLRANPGYWGAPAPRVLVLGFSKGANQIAAAASGGFDGVAFAGARPRLQRVLEALGVDLEGQSIDQALSAQSRILGAASLIRCGLSILKDGKLQTSGTIMSKAARTPFTLGVMKTCISRHLDSLPDCIKTVVVLGTTDAYIKGVKTLMRGQFHDYRDINDVAFRAQGRTWVFAAHPSPANGGFHNWLEADAASASGRKRVMAQRALGVDLSRAPETPLHNAVTDMSNPAAVGAKKRAHAARRNKGSRDEFARTFHLVRNDGMVLVPVRMKNTDTGRVAFRVAKSGNTKDGEVEVTDEAQLLTYCQSGQYQVRARPLNKSTPASYVRPLLNCRIVVAPAF